MTQLGSNAQLGSNVQMGMDPNFNPLWFSGCVVWFDMQDPTTFATNSSLRMLSIVNKASGVAWTEATNGPFYDPVGFGGAFPTMQFNGANRIISSEAAALAAMTNSPALTVIAAIQSDLPNSSVYFFSAANSGATSNNSRGWGTNTLGTGNWLAGAVNSSGTSVTVSSASSTDNANPNIFEYFTDGSVSSIVINGATPDPNGAAQAIGTFTPDRMALGCSPRSVINAFWTGKVSELLVFNRQLTDFERAIVRTHLQRKWGIADPTPLTILGSAAWWVRADQGVTIATGVSQWNDLSGNGVNFAQATGANQPLFVAGAINGQPSIRGNGALHNLTATFARAAPGTQPFYVWLVAKQITWTLNDWVCADFGASGSGIRQRGSTPGVEMVGTSSVNNNVGGVLNTYNRIEAQWSASVSDYLKVGTTNATGGNAGNSAGAGTYYLFGSSLGSNWNGEIAEAFLYLGTPTAAQRAWLDAYAYLRYGPTLNVG